MISLVQDLCKMIADASDTSAQVSKTSDWDKTSACSAASTSHSGQTRAASKQIFAVHAEVHKAPNKQGATSETDSGSIQLV